MTTNLDNKNFAMRAVSRIFRKSYAAAISVDGAYERVNEKISDLRQGIRNRRNEFISTEAIIHVTAIHRRISFEDAKLRHNNKTKDEIVKTKKAIRNNESLWEKARRFDRDGNGGQRFVTQYQEDTKIIFMCSDDRKLEFDLQHCSDDVRSWLSSIGTPTRIDEVIEVGPIIRRRIFEITKWSEALIEQALDCLASEDKITLYANHHLSQFRNLLISEERKINKPLNRIFIQDISDALLSLLDTLNETGSS
ncbi:MAG: hypothetical protein HY306_07440 [Nitrosomonadales bacterium]|nr:hypothetical protein [Nitrosomonadales bacterium]